MKWLTLNVLMYGLLLVALFIVNRIEQNDWHCHNPYEWWEKCKVADEGMAFRGSTPKQGDSSRVLLDKIDNAAGAENNSIKWRRTLIVSTIIVFLIFVLVITPANLPEWNIFYLSILISWAILYFNFSNYSYHKYGDARRNIEASTNMLRENL